MGARGVHRVCDELRDLGFSPIELERYCGSNKIWATKVKRLRLPDLLCVKTGLRLEVRAKSDLKIRMSDAPNNPDRVWDAGLTDQDVVALIACGDGPDGPVPADSAIYFTVGALRDSVGQSKLGAPKSASEGAERDRTWPATVPKRPGRVISVTDEKLVVMMEGDGNPSRKQTYTLNGKRTYVCPGDRFEARVTFLAGAPEAMADLHPHLERQYDPLDAIKSADAVDRYAAVKAIRFRDDLHAGALGILEQFLDTEAEPRVALEAAGSAAFLESDKGQEYITDVLWGDGPVDLSMEAILILTELATAFARNELVRIAGAQEFEGDERRQAALWGLGKAGLKSYGDLVPFIGDEEENVAYHAIAGFGPDTPQEVIAALIERLLTGDPQIAPGASEALRVIGGEEVLRQLNQAAQSNAGVREWALATIGRLPPDMVRDNLQGSPLLDQLAPMLLIAEGANWLSGEDAMTDMAFLLKQNI